MRTLLTSRRKTSGVQLTSQFCCRPPDDFDVLLLLFSQRISVGIRFETRSETAVSDPLFGTVDTPV